MLEHSDRYDAVETLGDLAVVLQAELDRARQSFLVGARARERELFLRERHAGDARVEELGKIKPEPAPSGADVEHARLRLDEKLRGDMALLGKLRVVERLLGMFEIGAAVLPVGIEEQRIEPAV